MGRGDHDRPAGIDDVGDHFLAVGRRRAGRAGVREHVDPDLERVAHVLFGVDVRVHADAVLVRGVGNRLVVLARQARVRLDDVDAGLGEPLDLLRRLRRSW